MNHLSQEEFVLTYYGEPELGAARRAHIDACEACRGELAQLARVLDQVTPLAVPEPSAGFEERVWDRVQWRLRGEKRQRSGWIKWAAVAAVVAVAFLSGVLWKTFSRVDEPAGTIATATTPASLDDPTGRSLDHSKRVLRSVVGEHIDESERVLVELSNITPGQHIDLTASSERAEELLASNRLYRTSAAGRGEEDVATLLDELEPILMQIAHASPDAGAEEIRKLQKRVENKGLVFKLRVVRADLERPAPRPASSTDI